MNTLAVFNEERASEAEIELMTARDAARGVVVDTDGNVALLDNVKRKYFSVPGGGVEFGETTEEALVRECKEEIACDVRILREIGKTIEYRKQRNIVNISHAFLAVVLGEKGIPVPTGDEKEAGSVVIWVPVLKAIQLVASTPLSSDPAALYANYVTLRDIAILKEAERMIGDL